MMKKINGQATHIELEGGFWGISTSSSNYYPINFPEQLKYNNKAIEVQVEILEDIMTMQNWGTPCRIISFSTIF